MNGKVVCYIIHWNVHAAYSLIDWLTGVNILQGLIQPQDAALKEIVQQNLIGGSFLRCKKEDSPLIVNSFVMQL